MTAYYKPFFGSIISNLKSVGYTEDNMEVFEYTFFHKNDLYKWLRITNLKIRKGDIYKGKTWIGAYVWDNEKAK